MGSSVSPSSGSPETIEHRSYADIEYASSPILEPEDDYDVRVTSKNRAKAAKSKAKRKPTRDESAKKRRSQSDSGSGSENEDDSYKYKSKPVSKSNSREDDSFSASDQEAQSITKPLTKRQKAKYLDEHTEELQELKEESKKRHFTAEELALRRSETARRRKHQSQQKAEKDKLETINRLLKKQANKKSRADQQRENNQDPEAPVTSPKLIRYISLPGEATLSFPKENMHLLEDFKSVSEYPPSKPTCMVEGCSLPKKYCHPQTHKLSCSLEHHLLLSPDVSAE